MNQEQNVKDILVAIASVRSRATKALNSGDLVEYSRLMYDLLALEQCLVIHTELMIAA
jgi:hypothetical protein